MIAIRAGRVRLLKVFGMCVLFFAAMAWMAFDDPRDKEARGVGIVGMAFSGLGMAAVGFKALGSRITLVLDREGLITLPSRTPVHRVPWEQVTRIQVWSLSGQEFVGIDVRDRSVLGDGPLAKVVRAADIGVSGCAINIPDSMIDRSAKELVDLLERYCASPEERSRLGVWDPRPPAPR